MTSFIMIRKTSAVIDRLHNALANGKPVPAADVSALQVVKTREEYFGFYGTDLSYYVRQYDVIHDASERRSDFLQRRVDQLSRDHARLIRDLQEARGDARTRLLRTRDQIATDRHNAHEVLNAALVDVRVAADMIGLLTRAQAARAGYGVMELEMAPAQIKIAA
jgi:hypothetical protein